METILKGVGFPFRFNSTGGVAKQELSPFDQTLIQSSSKQVLSIRAYEILMEPEIGNTIMQELFNVRGDITDMAVLRHKITNELGRREQRIEVEDVRVYTVNDEEKENSDVTTRVSIDAVILQLQKKVTFEYEINDKEVIIL